MIDYDSESDDSLNESKFCFEDSLEVQEANFKLNNNYKPSNTNAVITIQRYLRGFLGRMKASRIQLMNERNKLKSKKKLVTIRNLDSFVHKSISNSESTKPIPNPNPIPTRLDIFNPLKMTNAKSESIADFEGIEEDLNDSLNIPLQAFRNQMIVNVPIPPQRQYKNIDVSTTSRILRNVDNEKKISNPPPKRQSYPITSNIKELYEKSIQPNISRQRIKQLQARQAEAAITIQRTFRGFIGRKVAKKRRQKLADAIRCWNCKQLIHRSSYCKVCGRAQKQMKMKSSKRIEQTQQHTNLQATINLHSIPRTNKDIMLTDTIAIQSHHNVREEGTIRYDDPIRMSYIELQEKKLMEELLQLDNLQHKLKKNILNDSNKQSSPKKKTLLRSNNETQKLKEKLAFTVAAKDFKNSISSDNTNRLKGVNIETRRYDQPCILINDNDNVNVTTSTSKSNKALDIKSENMKSSFQTSQAILLSSPPKLNSKLALLQQMNNENSYIKGYVKKSLGKQGYQISSDNKSYSSLGQRTSNNVDMISLPSINSSKGKNDVISSFPFEKRRSNSIRSAPSRF